MVDVSAARERAGRILERLATRQHSQGFVGGNDVYVLALARDVIALADAVRTLREALAFYADENNWTQPTSWGGRIFDDEAAACDDCGAIARAALAAGSPPEGEAVDS